MFNTIERLSILNVGSLRFTLNIEQSDTHLKRHKNKPETGKTIMKIKSETFKFTI